MEIHSPFDLESAIATWRAELARHPGPAPADLRELETHLREAFAKLQGHQLSDEEAFLIACRRFGPAEPVAAEFAKGAPQNIWRSRIFWLSFGLLMTQLWSVLMESSWNILRVESYSWNSFYWRDLFIHLGTPLVMALEYLLPVILAGIWIARGLPRFLISLFSTRERVAASSMVSALIAFILYMYWMMDSNSPFTGNSDLVSLLTNGRSVSDDFRFFVLYFYYVWPAFLIGFLVWLAPGRTAVESRKRKQLPSGLIAGFLVMLTVLAGTGWLVTTYQLQSIAHSERGNHVVKVVLEK